MRSTNKSRRLLSKSASLLTSAIEPLENRWLLSVTLAPKRSKTPSPPSAPITLNVWPTYTQAVADLNTLHTQYPTISNLVNIGTTVQGRTIYAMEITDNPGVNEDEPEFFYQGQIHGDEPIGMENSFQMMSEMLGNYGGSTATAIRETNLINNMDLWFVPSMNWDGYNASSPSVGHRGNANNVDLNRNFPEWTSRSFSSDTKYFGHYGNVYDGPVPTTTLLQPETTAMMNFLRAHRFVASVNFHSGDLVVNYPWDTDGSVGANYAVAPDDALFKQMALVYATQNTPMYNNNSSPFVHGTTNGDNWYPISGGEQDWANLYTGDHQFTIELDNVEKYPPASQLATFWANNRESMLQYMETANWGVRGLVTDANTGAPLFAKITLTAPAPSPTPDANHPASVPIFTDAGVGDYHRQLLPGTYTMKFEASGYNTQNVTFTVSSTTNDPTQTFRRDVQMVPIDVTAPTVTGGAFTFNGSPQTLAFTFSEQVQGVDNTDLILTNNTTSSTVPSSDIVLDSYNTTSHVATFRFNDAGGTLPGASYSATFNTAGITDTSNNQLAGGYSYNFLYAAGASGNDTVYAMRSGSLLKVWQNANPQTDPATYSATWSTLSNFSIDGFAGNDTIQLDFTGGDMRPAGASGFGWRMGANSETLHLTGPVTWNFTVDPTTTDTPNLALVLDTGAAATFAAPVSHFSSLSLDSNSSATLLAGSARLLVTRGLSIAGGASLELNDNDLIDFYTGGSALSSVSALIAQARASGDWSGTGITSLAAKNDAGKRTGLGAIEADDYRTVYGAGASFDGEALSGQTAVLVKYTWYGDTDFNGKVDGADYARIDTNFNNEVSTHVNVGGWFNGDFDFNGKLDGADYALIDSVFNSQSGLLRGKDPHFTQNFVVSALIYGDTVPADCIG